mgnify:FL=1
MKEFKNKEFKNPGWTSGTRVKMKNCYEAEASPNTIWITRGLPWALGHGQYVVSLEGRNGGFAVDCLDEVEGGK